MGDNEITPAEMIAQHQEREWRELVERHHEECRELMERMNRLRVIETPEGKQLVQIVFPLEYWEQQKQGGYQSQLYCSLCPNHSPNVDIFSAEDELAQDIVHLCGNCAYNAGIDTPTRK